MTGTPSRLPSSRTLAASLSASRPLSPWWKWTSRSVRIGFVNASRGVGCYLESSSHGFEGTATSGAVDSAVTGSLAYNADGTLGAWQKEQKEVCQWLLS